MLKYWSSGVSKNHTKASILQISHFNCEAHDLLYERSQGHEKTSLFSQKKEQFWEDMTQDFKDQNCGISVRN